MSRTIKAAIKRFINFSVTLLAKTTGGRYLYEQIIALAMDRTQAAEHAGYKLVFSVPNGLNKYRADTFSTKEPETLHWIDGISSTAVLWDIGANVGLYTCYAGKTRGCSVFSFEPSVFNLEILARNIFLNGLTDRVTVVPLPLSDKLAFDKLNMTGITWGGAMSTFGQSYGHDGELMHRIFEFPTIGLSMLDAVNLLKIPQPDYIKMDVDGIEHLILKGGLPILQRVKSILIEVNDKFRTQADGVSLHLQQAGFLLKEKRHAAFLDEGSSKYTFNQIWSR